MFVCRYARPPVASLTRQLKQDQSLRALPAAPAESLLLFEVLQAGNGIDFRHLSTHICL